MEKQDFIKNPSKEQLKTDLELIGKIIDAQNKHKEIVIEDRIVYEIDNQKGRNELGTHRDINALTIELFGEEKPDGVEYRTFDGVTFMTYYGHLIACGDGSQLPDAWTVDLLESINGALESEVVEFIGTVWDCVMYPGMYTK